MSSVSPNDTSPPRDSYANSDHGQGPPRKKMRKGTKSCLECRRRKIKCTFEANRTQVCNECYARGSTCIDQEHGDIQNYTQNVGEQSAYSLRERVTQLEDLVKQVLYRIPDKSEDSTAGVPQERTQVDTQAAEVLKSLRNDAASQITLVGATEEPVLMAGGLRDDAPTLTLFDNAVITRKDTQPVVSRSQYNKSKTVIGALNQLLPSARDLDTILEHGQEWWAIWRKMFPDITDRRCSSIKESVSHSLRSEKPAEVAKITVCIAISIHQLPLNFDWSRLEMKEDPTEYMERCINTVNRLITSDDEICATLDGIECVFLEAKYHINMGRPRRAWLLVRRLLAFAELLGLHRLAMASQPSKPDIEHERVVSLWGHIVMVDRWLSLVLGLPYGVPEAMTTPLIPFMSEVRPGNSEGESYAGRMIPIMTRIIDRNQNPTPMPFSASLRLDQDLEELHQTKDPSWWTTQRFDGATVEDHFDRLQAQSLHHHARLLIHLPFMLKSSTDKRFQYSQTAALDAAREMIRYYDALRTDKTVGPYVCKLQDFQAFTAGMLLLLNLCGYSQQSRSRSQQPDLESDQQDSELIDLTISLLHDASKEAGGVVAAQSARALEMLGQARNGACDEGIQESCKNETMQVSIPYFGTISVGMGKHFVVPKAGTYPSTGYRQIPGMQNNAGNASGLPTPPSLGTQSCQQSPMSANIDSASIGTPNLLHATNSQTSNSRSSHRLPNYEGTDYIAPGLTQPWPDDPLVTFDSFMPLPATMDYSGADYSGSVSSGSGWTPGSFPSSGPVTAGTGGISGVPGAGMGGVVGQGGAAIWENGLQGTAPITGFPFGNVDLDQGWNWFGIDNPVL